ncbi:DHH family phosphoesterase [Thermoactinomyces mirandus]|uniref:Bifunctional oligoribonuclease/PAP phosphatase NrnA n=1 Tax=Thermoactinomyces mirandus TaxID=2756294 RepID=A0A7W2AQL5_9BACL|nr:bifunctional oligoribonuclease/PAP phosphatase NrnA [Thermoactinomyces mirandus]MBA4602089.1 bifunctional oligoribonuclease/PAP phosphatase NrnA [Thermoactinomyces mirandus]
MNQFEQFHLFLENADPILVVAHLYPDGDAISSTLAMGYVLRQLGKKVTMVNESPIPQKFSFLPGVEEIKLADSVSEIFPYAIALDCADAERMGSCRSLIREKAIVVNIDHHATNDRYGTINIIQPQAAATAEIIFDWVEEADFPVDRQLAACIYTGLLTDTGGFRYSNTSSKVFTQAAKLLETGIESHKIADAVLETVTMEQLQLLQTALSTLQKSEDGLVAWMDLRKQDIDRFANSHEDLDGIVNYARNIYGVDVGILFHETNDRTIKVSFRSREMVDVGNLAKSFGGGGHARAAGCSISGTLQEAHHRVLSLVQSKLKQECEV